MSQSSVFQKILRGVLSGAALAGVTALVGILNLRLIVQDLPSESAGIWIVLLTIGNYLIFFDIGFGPTLSREIAFSDGKIDRQFDQQHEKANLIATTRRTVLVISFILLLIGGPFGWYLLSGSAVELLQTWGIFLCGGLLAMNGSVAHSALYGLGHVALERTIRIVSQLAWLLLTYIFLKSGYGIRGAALAWILQTLIARSVAFLVLHKYEPWIRKKNGRFNADLFKKMLTPSVRWAATTLGALLILQSGNLIVASVVGLDFVPQYEALSKLSMAVMTLGLLIATSSSPFLSRAHAANDRELFNSIFFRNLKIGVAITISCVLFALFYGESIVDIWLGPGKYAGFPTLLFLMMMTTLEVHHVIFAVAAMASGFVPFAPWAVGAGLLNIGIGILLAGPFGLAGMAAATFTAQVLTNNWFVPYFVFRKMKVSVPLYLQTVLMPVLIFGFGNIATLWLIGLLSSAVSGHSVNTQVAVAFCLHSISVLIQLYFIILSSEERKHLRRES